MGTSNLSNERVEEKLESVGPYRFYERGQLYHRHQTFSKDFLSHEGSSYIGLSDGDYSVVQGRKARGSVVSVYQIDFCNDSS